MILYRLSIAPGEDDGEGEDHDEWFSSLREARARRRELIAEFDVASMRYTEDFAIDRMVTNDELTQLQLVLACLNGAPVAFQKVERFVKPWTPHRRRRRMSP